jgi:hypothetical protein
VNESSSGMQIFDLSDPLQPQWAGRYDSTFTRAHNIGIYEGYAYIAGSRQGNTNAGMRILDLSDPVHPVEVGVYLDHYVHDVFGRGDRVYTSNINHGDVAILDVSDPAHPTPIGSVPVGNAAHQCWLTDDGRYLLTAQENSGGHLNIWDVQDPQNPVFVSYWRTQTNGLPNDATIHNVFVRGDTAYAAWYAEGLQVIDISDIVNPKLVAEVDTRPTQTSGYKGMWGVYPFASNGLVYCSDMLYGLYVVRLTEKGPQSDFLIQAPDAMTVPAGATSMRVEFDVFNGALFAEDFTVALSNSQGWHMVYPTLLHMERDVTAVVAADITVPPGHPGGIRLDVELCLTSLVTGDAGCGQTQDPTAVLLQDLRAQASAAERPLLTWEVAPQPGDAPQLLVLRRPADRPQAWQTRARLDWGTRQWEDPQPLVGIDAVYALGQDVAGALQLLAQVTWSTSLPAAFQLFGNTPNPFNPGTRVRFLMPHPGRVSLSIHDVRGRLVRTLAASFPEPGAAFLDWDGRDARGGRVPSGVYPYVVRSGRWQARGSMTLVR